jgi:peptide deformylase
MILPIIAFGSPILRKKCKDITVEYPELGSLLLNMWETMYKASGVGLAAPQINKAIRLFLIDTTPFADDEEESEEQVVKKVFINARIIKETGEDWDFNEGCLSIPEVREDIARKPSITIKYMDENFEEHTETYDGLTARVIQHEYDHIDGVLFTDKLSALRKRMIKGKLMDISKGKVDVSYKMRFTR